MYVSNSGSNSWGGDLLGKSTTLSNGSSASVNYNSEYAYYDLKIVFMNGAHREWTGNQRLNLSGAWRITIYRNGTDSSGYERFAVSKN